MKQQSIIRIVEPFILNFIIENDDKDDKDDDKDNEDSDQKSMSAPSHSLGSPPAAGTTAISPTTSSMSSNKKRKLYKGMSNNNDNDDNDVEMLYSHLSRVLRGENNGFDLTNPSALKSMQALLTELTHIFSTEYKLKVKDIAKNGHKISYVRVPRTSSDRSFQNSKECHRPYPPQCRHSCCRHCPHHPAVVTTTTTAMATVTTTPTTTTTTTATVTAATTMTATVTALATATA
jgi:hypothetical protein